MHAGGGDGYGYFPPDAREMPPPREMHSYAHVSAHGHAQGSTSRNHPSSSKQQGSSNHPSGGVGSSQHRSQDSGPQVESDEDEEESEEEDDGDDG